jgi:RNA polymerase sigma factor (sigma-70 family)
MVRPFRSGTLGLIRDLFETGTCTGLSDARLLERFVTHRDEAAFAAMVARYGALVLNTCRAVLKDPNAADDAFQATFVLLFRKARSIRGRDALGAWLHRVAYRTALRARAAAARRLDVEKAAGALRVAETRAPDDSAVVLHEEIERLPDRFRLPVVLCDLDGMTRDQAADYLGCTEGSVRGRLAKGRELLRRRLIRRGMTHAVPLVVPAGLPESLVATTLRAAAGEVSGSIATLVKAASRGWLLGRISAAAVAVLTLGTAAALCGAGLLAPEEAPPTAGPSVAQTPATAPKTEPSPPAAAGPKAPQAKAAAPKNGPPLVEGRILDLEGRPIAGATVRVKYVQSPPNGKLDAWIDEVKRLGKQPFGLPLVAMPGQGSSGPSLAQSFLANLGLGRKSPSFSATTGPDGRFRLEGLPRDGIATASITGPGIETSEVYILTRDLPTIRVKDPMIANGPMIVYYGTRFDHVAATTQPIVGIVRDKDTGAPIPGVHITGMPNIPHNMIATPGVEATTDAQGHYQVNGLSISRGFKLFTEVPAGQPYVNGGFVSPAGEPKPGPFTFDITLKRGVLVRGRLTDKATGKPLHGSVSYHAFQDNRHIDEFPNFKRESQETRILITGPDGRFTIPALPGRGLISARAPEEGYLHGLGADAIKGFDRRMGAFATCPFYCATSDKHVFAEINPAPGTKEITIELQADPGQTVRGTIVGPDGQPIVGGVEIRTLDVFQGPQPIPRNSSTFEVKGLPSGRYRLDFFHPTRKLAGSLHLKGDETGKLTVKLQPWGTVIGRVVDEEGKPRTDVEIFSTIRERPDPESGDLEEKPTVDAKGRFRIKGLVPGVKYDALGHSPNRASGPILKGVLVGPGEVKDLGDIKLPNTKIDGN